MKPRPPKSPAAGLEELFGRLARAQEGAVDAAPGTRDVVELDRLIGSPGRRRPLVTFAFAGAAALACLAGFWLTFSRPLRFHVGPEGRSGAPGMALVARASTDLPLRFSDGSAVVFRAGSEGRVERLNEAGADVVLDGGEVLADIHHAARTRWRFVAGSYAIRVVGTRFSVRWARDARELVVSLHEGRVVIEGPGLPAEGFVLTSGNSLHVAQGGRRIGVAPVAPAAPTATVSSPATAPTTPERTPPDATTPERPPLVRLPLEREASARFEWVALAERGRYPAAWRAARAFGVDRLCAGLGAERLVALGDAARFAGSTREAERVFGCLIHRFPDHPLAADAVFALGRLAFASGRHAEAAHWFALYGDRWPSQALAEEAAGRLFEARARAGDDQGARAAAAAYLERYSAGAHAALARRLRESPLP